MVERKFVKKLIIMRQLLSRAYAWVQTPAMIALVVGVLSPYIKQVVDIPTWQMAAIAFVVLIVVGLIDFKLGMHSEEANYGMRRSELLTSRFDTIDKNIKELREELNGEA